VARKEVAYEKNNQRFHFGRSTRKGKARCREEWSDGQRLDFNANRKTKIRSEKMLKFYGKPHELRQYLRSLTERFGEKQKLIAVCIMLKKEFDEKNEFRL
jgi:hypothetical protein